MTRQKKKKKENINKSTTLSLQITTDKGILLVKQTDNFVYFKRFYSILQPLNGTIISNIQLIYYKNISAILQVTQIIG